jgi:hypothetical protein
MARMSTANCFKSDSGLSAVKPTTINHSLVKMCDSVIGLG